MNLKISKAAAGLTSPSVPLQLFDRADRKIREEAAELSHGVPGTQL